MPDGSCAICTLNFTGSKIITDMKVFVKILSTILNVLIIQVVQRDPTPEQHVNLSLQVLI